MDFDNIEHVSIMNDYWNNFHCFMFERMPFPKKTYLCIDFVILG